jgi:quercetin dioxygenase-like cupin family protein
MTKAILMKRGKSLDDKQVNGALFRNVYKKKELGANITHLLPGAKTEQFKHNGQEIHYIIAGKVTFHVGKEKYHMLEGDMLFHDSGDTHWSKNSGPCEAVYLTISTPFTFSLK